MAPLKEFFKQHIKLRKSQADTFFESYQETMGLRQDLILSTMQDITNYELWVASGIGCSICNPYYHDKFDLMGRDGLYFDDLAYCSNFYRNSNNYLGAFRNMRYIQHNLNVILNYLKVKNKQELFGTLNDKKNFMIWIRHKEIRYNASLNPQNVWRYGLKFGIEYSSDKLLSQRAKVNNCIEEIQKKNYSIECQDICLQTNPPNEVTISGQKFVTNLLMAEYIIDMFWKTTFPGKYSTYIDQDFPEVNMDEEIVLTYNQGDKNSKDPKKEEKPPMPKRPMLRRQVAFKAEVKDKEDNSVGINLKATNNFNIVKYFFEEMQKISFDIVFNPKTNLGNKENKHNFIQFEDLDKNVITSKAAWIPFPNCMNYENVRVTYYDHALRTMIGLQLLAAFALLFKLFN